MRTGNTVEGQLRQTNVYLLEFTRTASKTFVQQLDHLDRIYSSQRPALRQCNNKMFDDLLVSQPTGTRFRPLHKRSPPGGCGARGSETGEPVRTPGQFARSRNFERLQFRTNSPGFEPRTPHRERLRMERDGSPPRLFTRNGAKEEPPLNGRIS